MKTEEKGGWGGWKKTRTRKERSCMFIPGCINTVNIYMLCEVVYNFNVKYQWQGLALWQSSTNNPSWAPVCVLAAFLPIKLSTNGLGKAVEDCSSVWAPTIYMETWVKILAPGVDMVRHWPQQLSGSQSVDLRFSLSSIAPSCSVSLSLHLSVTLTFKINL